MSTAASLFFHSVRYTRPRQLLFRVLLTAKRKFLARFASPALKKNTASMDNPPPLRADLPLPLFPPRRHLVASAQPLRVRFLNQERNIELPLDWRPRELRTGTRLWLLNLHYMEFLEALDDRRCFAYILDWIEKNLPYDAGYWLDNWNSFSLSIRAVVWMQQLAARETSALDEADKRRILSSLAAQIRFLHGNLELDIGGNHIVKNIKTLLWAGRFFDGPEAALWQRTGLQLLEREMREQILPDGMHYELSPAYHTQVFADLLECYSVLPVGTIKEQLRAHLTRMAQCQVDFTHPDGLCSLLNDGGLDMAYRTSECQAVFSQLIPKKMQPHQKIEYPAAGYYGVRKDAQLVLIDCGALAPDFLPAHGHGDALSFEWSIKDQRAIIDPGVFEYNDGKMRAHSRSTSSHNTVTLDDLDQSQFWKAFRVGRRARIVHRKVEWRDDALYLEGAHDGYAHLPGGPLHKRTFMVGPAGIRMDDEIQGGAQQRATARLMLNPACTIERTGPASIVCTLGPSRFCIAASNDIELTETLCFLKFGFSQRTRQVVVHYGAAPVRGHIELRLLD